MTGALSALSGYTTQQLSGAPPASGRSTYSPCRDDSSSARLTCSDVPGGRASFHGTLVGAGAWANAIVANETANEGAKMRRMGNSARVGVRRRMAGGFFWGLTSSSRAFREPDFRRIDAAQPDRLSAMRKSRRRQRGNRPPDPAE